jgi:hypothetical protein
MRPLAPGEGTDPVDTAFDLVGESGAPSRPRRNEVWLETPVIGPGETLTIDLNVERAPNSRVRSRTAEFSIFTVAAEDDAGLVKEWKVNVALGE